MSDLPKSTLTVEGMLAERYACWKRHRGDTELMFASCPSEFCADAGRSIVNAGPPPIVKRNPSEPKPEVTAWLDTLSKGVRMVYDYWNQNIVSGGFKSSARAINFSDGKPGEVGRFFSWPKATAGIL